MKIPIAVTRTVARTILHIQKSSPTLLFGAGIVGFGSTVVLASKATLHVDEVLQEGEKRLMLVEDVFHEQPGRYTKRNYQSDVITIRTQTALKLCRLYAPAVIVGVVTVACLTKSHHILKSRNAALTAANALVWEEFNRYRERVKAELGDEKEYDLRFPYEACEIEVPNSETGTMEVIEGTRRKMSVYARLFDSNSRSFQKQPDYNLVFLRVQQQQWNDALTARGHVFLNEVYDALDIPRSKEGAIVGWRKNGKDGYIDFGIFDKNMSPRVLDFFQGNEQAILLDFNVDGVIYDKI